MTCIERRVVLAWAALLAAGSISSGDCIAGVGGDGAVPGTALRDCAKGCPEMVVIPPGTFYMGPMEGEEESEKTTNLERTSSAPRHLVTISYKFALGKYDVTRREFSTFVNETGYPIASDCHAYARPSESTAAAANWANPGFPQTDLDPVVCVSWDDAQVYLAWLSRKTHHRYRLPSEAEWEYAARARTSTSRFWGDDSRDACLYANVADLTYMNEKNLARVPGNYFDCSDGYVSTSPVGSFRPNGFGLYDVLGNVFQLTEDCLNYSYVGAPADGSPWLSGDCVPHIARGGSFGKLPKIVRSAFRFNIPSFLQSNETGFRVARDIR